ncbi:MAG: GNAT family N-acetyltransferase [Planctomycetes bacterium]|nr:GNAT family N-acetyltransferase [Planctomycetota bacterium]
MISGDNTSIDWQVHTGTVCILPIGACEQHSTFLPLATDTIHAEYFARMLAEDLDAALLPALPIGTSLEHAGFRGSISLRPETMMQVIRDLADELERQRFRVLILLNGHGGNFCLGPVARDINRMDRQLKILLVNHWEFWPAGVACESAHRGQEIHCGEGETSAMLAIRPDLVRAPVVDTAPLADGVAPLHQRDLNTFGMGHFSADGVVGYPSYATAEKGRKVVELARAPLTAHVRDRLQRLVDQPRYSGMGGIASRVMTANDIIDGMRLKSVAGWNQLEDDWRLFLSARPTGSFVAVHNGQVVGSAATIVYPSTSGSEVAWIGMVLVDPEFRRMGIGTLLLDQAIRSLGDGPTIKLDATPAGREVYKKRGFVDERPLTRWTHACLPVIHNAASAPRSDTAPIPDRLDAIAAIDRGVFGADRSMVLGALSARGTRGARCLMRAGSVVAYCLARPGTNFHQLGPIVADSSEDARAVASAALTDVVGRPVVIDVPDEQTAFSSWLASLGFAAQRTFIRMRRGGAGGPSQPAREFAIVGPEFG